MTSSQTGSNLLFGILALQLDFVSQEAFIRAMHIWVRDKTKSLGTILCEHQALSAEHQAILDTLVDKHLKHHNQSLAKSMASLSVAPSLASQLHDLADQELEASLAPVSTWQGEIPYRESSFATGRLPGQRFRTLRPHARGGLGQVFVALDREFNRQVALKEIQEHYAHDSSSRARFMREAELTGRLEHPGIVPVYSLGCYADGRPYYAMRFIQGTSLKEAIDALHKSFPNDSESRGVELRKLLRRFSDVCNALTYAHSCGVVHRDIKPANIMLGEFGETLVVDWGLAKAFDRPDKRETDVLPSWFPSSESGSGPTEMGAVLGTPAYMSPEQAAGRLDLIGPATDVYSLGATLYALLTGRPPFEDTAHREVLGKVQSGNLLKPRDRDKTIHPALEAICLKAMALRPEDRYKLPRDLADDLDHWIAGEAVSAWPDPWTVRARRWVSRHRTSVTGVAAAVVVATLSLGIATALLTRANHDLNIANTNERRAKEEAVTQKGRAVASYQLARKGLESTLEISEDERLRSGKLEDLRKKLAQAGASFYEQFVNLQGDEESFRFERAMAYSRLGVELAVLGNRQEAVSNFGKAASALEQLHEEFKDNLKYQTELQMQYHDLGHFLIDLKRLPEAEEYLKKARQLQETLISAQPDETEHTHAAALSLLNLGMIYRDTNRMEEAEAAFNESLPLYEAITRNQPRTGKTARYWSFLANLLSNRGYLYALTGQPLPGIADREKGIEIMTEVVELNPAVTVYQKDLAMFIHFLGMTYQFQSNWSKAEEYYKVALDRRQKLVDDHPAVPEYKSDLADTLYQMALVYQKTHRDRLALQEYPKIVKIYEGLLREFPYEPDRTSKLAWACNDLGMLAERLGQFDKAKKSHRQAVDLRRALSNEFPLIEEYQTSLLDSLKSLGALSWKMNQLEAAREAYAECLHINQSLYKADPQLEPRKSNLADAYSNTAFIAQEQDRLQDAQSNYQKALGLFMELAAQTKNNAKNLDRLADCQTSLGWVNQELGHNAEAQNLFKATIEVRTKAHNTSSQGLESACRLARAYLNLGNSVGDSKMPSDALVWFEKSLSLLTPYLENQRSNKVLVRTLVDSHTGHGWILSKFLGKHEEALKAYDSALELSKDQGSDWIPVARACVLARLGRHKEAVDKTEAALEKNMNDTGNLYDAASVYALAAASVKADNNPPAEDRNQLIKGYQSRSLELLTSALKKGYFNPPSKRDMLMFNKDFESLHELQAFQDLARK
ncbi:MAG: protein kinase domain-containing protein [Gemmataceae bacterium]